MVRNLLRQGFFLEMSPAKWRQGGAGREFRLPDQGSTCADTCLNWQRLEMVGGEEARSVFAVLNCTDPEECPYVGNPAWLEGAKAFAPQFADVSFKDEF